MINYKWKRNWKCGIRLNFSLTMRRAIRGAIAVIAPNKESLWTLYDVFRILNREIFSVDVSLFWNSSIFIWFFVSNSFSKSNSYRLLANNSLCQKILFLKDLIQKLKFCAVFLPAQNPLRQFDWNLLNFFRYIFAYSNYLWIHLLIQ